MCAHFTENARTFMEIQEFLQRDYLSHVGERPLALCRAGVGYNDQNEGIGVDEHSRGHIIRLQFLEEEFHQQQEQADDESSGRTLLGSGVDLLELRRDWRELASLLFVKGKAWENESEVRLLVSLNETGPLNKSDKDGPQ